MVPVLRGALLVEENVETGLVTPAQEGDDGGCVRSHAR
jgi:hypothetical protein